MMTENDKQTSKTPQLLAIIQAPVIMQPLTPRRRTALFCIAATKYNKQRLHNALVTTQENDQEIDLTFYPHAANELKPTAPVATPSKTITDIPDNLDSSSLTTTTLPESYKEANATFKFHKDSGILSISTHELTETQAQETIKAGIELVTQACIEGIPENQGVELSLDIPSHLAEVGAKALLQALENYPRINHLNLHHNPERSEAFLIQLARLSANNLKLRVKIQALLCDASALSSPEAEFFNAELTNHADPTPIPHSLLDLQDQDPKSIATTPPLEAHNPLAMPPTEMTTGIQVENNEDPTN